MLVGDRVLALNRKPMRSHGRSIGSVTTLRDRTELSRAAAASSAPAGRPPTRCARRPTSSPTSCTRSPACSSSRSTTRWCASSTASADEPRRRCTTRSPHGSTDPALARAADRQGQPGRRARRGACGSPTEPGVAPASRRTCRVDLTTVVGNLVDNALDAGAHAAGADGAAGSRSPARGRPRRRRRRSATAARVSRRSWSSRCSAQGFSTKAPGAEASGRGFGLALTRLVCRRRGGEVTVHNEEGAVFTARCLPARPRRCWRDRACWSSTTTSWWPGSTRGFVERTPGLHASSGVAHTGARRSRRPSGCSPTWCCSTSTCPTCPGSTCCAALREAAPEVDVLVISAAREADTVRRALRGGIVHYLMKPFSLRRPAGAG